MSWNRFDPATFKAAVTSVCALLAGLGFTFATEERAFLISAAVAAVLAMIQGFATRASVTPNAKVLAYAQNPDRPSTTPIYAGGAVVPESRANAVVEAASREAA